jgi:hypothetical protein
MEQQVLDALNSLVGRPDKIQTQPTSHTTSTELENLQHQLDTVMEQQPIDEDVAKNLTLAIAAAQYDSLGSAEYETHRLRRLFSNASPMKSLDADLLRAAVSAIQKESDGTVSVRLKNNQLLKRSTAT